MVVERPKAAQAPFSAVLCSGGLDSAVLVAHEAQSSAVQPLYVSSLLAWEAVERQYLTRFLAALRTPNPVHRWVELDCPVADTYPRAHWALTGAAPAYATADEEVYLIGRNVLLLAKAAVYCALHRIERLAIGPLAGNPFPDATPEFFGAMARALSLGLAAPLRITAPFAARRKVEVIRMAADLGVPLEHTLSCMSPAAALHCGRCSKCRERLQAFDAAGVEDPADYAFRPSDPATGA